MVLHTAITKLSMNYWKKEVKLLLIEPSDFFEPIPDNIVIIVHKSRYTKITSLKSLQSTYLLAFQMQIPIAGVAVLWQLKPESATSAVHLREAARRVWVSPPRILTVMTHAVWTRLMLVKLWRRAPIEWWLKWSMLPSAQRGLFYADVARWALRFAPKSNLCISFLEMLWLFWHYTYNATQCVFTKDFLGCCVE